MSKNFPILFVRFICLCLLSVGTCMGATYTVALSGNWNNATTWAPAGIPGAGDDVIINLGNTVTLAADAQCRNLTITAPVVAGTTLLNTGNYNLDVSGNVILNGGGNNTKIARLNIRNGIVTVTGTFTYNASNALRAVVDMSSGSGTLKVLSNMVLSTAGTFTAGAASTFEYGGAAQNIGGFTYYNLTLSGSGSKTLLANTTINGKLSLQGTSSLNLSSKTLTYAAGATLEYKSSTAQTTATEFTSSNLPTNLIIDNTSAGGVTLGNNLLTVSTLSLTNGALNLNANTLIISSGLTSAISRTNGYIVSETTSATPGGGTTPVGPGYGIINWIMGGNLGAHIVPFGTSTGVVIPITFTLNSGNAGTVSLSTYKTTAANTPYPSGIPHVVDQTQVDNSSSTVDRFWILASSGVTANFDLTLSYAQLTEKPASTANGGAEADVYAQSWSGTKWAAALPGQIRSIGAGTPTSASSITVPAAGLPIGVWTVAKGISPLPVTLLSFKADKKDKQNILSWETASEYNVEAYIIEKSLNGTDFSQIAAVRAINSPSRHTYSITDESSSKDVFYRLSEKELNGSVNTFKVVRVKASSFQPEIFVSGSQLKIVGNDPGNKFPYQILNIQGQKIKEGIIDPQDMAVDIQDLPSGIYLFVSNIQGEESEVFKFSK